MVVTSKRSDSGIGELYLMRSYDHYRRRRRIRRSQDSDSDLPRRAPGAEDGTRRINYGQAAPFGIWEVARAATGIPSFFEPIRLKPLEGSENCAFVDSGFDTYKNPAREAILDVMEQSGAKSIRDFIDIGASQNEGILKRESFISKIRRSVDPQSDSDTANQETHAWAAQLGFGYYRFDESHGPYSLNVIFDEWKPKKKTNDKPSGKKTIDIIQRSFRTWATEEVNQAYLEECARRLFETRKARVEADSCRWERFATCRKWVCPEDSCSSDGTISFSKRNDFRDHLVSSHGFVRTSVELRAQLERYEYDFPYDLPPTRPVLERNKPSATVTISRASITQEKNQGLDANRSSEMEGLHAPTKGQGAKDELTETKTSLEEVNEAQVSRAPAMLQNEYDAIVGILNAELGSKNSYKLCPQVAIALDDTLLRLEVWMDEIDPEDERDEKLLAELESSHPELGSTLAGAFKILSQQVRLLLAWQGEYATALER